MIWCLHGNIGHPSDWDILNNSGHNLTGEIIRKVDLWRYLDCRSIGLEEFGDIFTSEVAAQDPNPYLIGYSMGGRLALNALTAQPNLWRGAALISTHPGLKTEEEKVTRRTNDAIWSAKALQSKWSDFLEEWNTQSVLGDLPTGMADRHLLQPRSLAVARAFCAWSLGEQRDFRELSRTIPCPITLITGEEDKKFTQLATEFNFPNSLAITIPTAKHRPLWENPTAVISTLKNSILSSSSL